MYAYCVNDNNMYIIKTLEDFLNETLKITWPGKYKQ